MAAAIRDFGALNRLKPLLILTRIILVGIFWSIIFLEGIRVIMLTNWRFDILRPSHWNYAWNLWLNGWVIDEVKEWAFILIILTFIPVWLTGWAALGMIKWGHIIEKILFLPLQRNPPAKHSSAAGRQQLCSAGKQTRRTFGNDAALNPEADANKNPAGGV